MVRPDELKLCLQLHNQNHTQSCIDSLLCMIIMCMVIHADTAATVEFAQSSYNVSESEGLFQVCASIDVKLEVNVSVSILSDDVTAQGVYT